MSAHHGCEHAQTAALARYGVTLAACDFAAMVQDIIATLVGDRLKAVLLSRTISGREIWIVRVPHGPAVRVVYEPLTAVIVTVLPPAWRSKRDAE